MRSQLEKQKSWPWSSIRADAFFTNLDLNTNSTNSEYDPTELLQILTSRPLKVKVGDLEEFAIITQINVKKLKTYSRAMSGPHAQQLSQAIKKELDELETNQMWELIYKKDIKFCYQLLEKQWVYKVKRDINRDIPQFQDRWIVKDQLQ